MKTVTNFLDHCDHYPSRFFLLENIQDMNVIETENENSAEHRGFRRYPCGGHLVEHLLDHLTWTVSTRGVCSGDANFTLDNISKLKHHIIKRSSVEGPSSWSRFYKSPLIALVGLSQVETWCASTQLKPPSGSIFCTNMSNSSYL